MTEMDLLTRLANEQRTDKGTKYSFKHGYTKKYYELLNPIRHDVKAVFEIGVFKRAASLRVWRDFFPQADIFGIDIEPEYASFNEPRLRSGLCDQENEQQIEAILDEFGRREFNVIIDDGGHTWRQQCISLYILKKYVVAPGGFYFIEDSECQGFHKRPPKLFGFYGGLVWPADSGARLTYYQLESEYYKDHPIKEGEEK